MHIAVANLKGGVGKTTTAVYLAAGFGRRAPTVLVDCDRVQAQAARWAQLAPELPYRTVRYTKADLPGRLASIASGAQHVVMDTPPGDEAIIAAAVAAADLLIVPVEPMFMQLDRIQPTIDLLADLDDARNVGVCILLTRVRFGTSDARAAREFLSSRGYPILKTEIPLLVGYHRSYGLVPPEGTHYGQLLDEVMSQAVAA